jgi:hypothetical protein
VAGDGGTRGRPSTGASGAAANDKAQPEGIAKPVLVSTTADFPDGPPSATVTGQFDYFLRKPYAPAALEQLLEHCEHLARGLQYLRTIPARDGQKRRRSGR